MKYLIKARIEVDGIVDKHDVIGALFGQTEGLLGEEYDLRDLQEKGRIGRIQVDLRVYNSRSVGEITIPSNLDRVETAIIAALLEIVDRVGPYNAKVVVTDLIDLREEKIKKVVSRAKEILNKWIKERAPDMKEIINDIERSVRAAEIIEYGPEKLPAGPDVDRAETVIIVEGRADVLNLLRYGYRNVIALEGAGGKVPETIVKLSREKNAIAFLDGDRGGDLILRELLRVADIDYIARAPEGKEVEELTGKEIMKCLKNAVPPKQYIEPSKERGIAVEYQRVPLLPETVTKIIRGLQGTLKAVLLDSNWNIIEEIPVRDLVEKISSAEKGKIHAILFDGVVTQRLVDIAVDKEVKMIIGARIGGITKMPLDTRILSFNDVLK